MKKAKAAIFCFAQNTGSTATTAAAAVDSNNDDWLHETKSGSQAPTGLVSTAVKTVSTVPGMMLKPF